MQNAQGRQQTPPRVHQNTPPRHTCSQADVPAAPTSGNKPGDDTKQFDSPHKATNKSANNGLAVQQSDEDEQKEDQQDQELLHFKEEEEEFPFEQQPPPLLEALQTIIEPKLVFSVEPMPTLTIPATSPDNERVNAWDDKNAIKNLITGFTLINKPSLN